MFADLRPGTRETDLLNPINTVEKVHAVVLSGGSAFGLEASCGVAKYLEEQGIGFEVGDLRIPIVVGAVLFDLAIGDSKCRPDREMGYRACMALSDTVFNQGNYGAGCGATVGKIRGMDYATKGGIGSYSIATESGLIVSAVVAVNALGDVYENGKIIAGALNDQKNGFVNTYKIMKEGHKRESNAIDNTTIGLVVTNAKLAKTGCKKVAQMAHNGYAKSILPVHTNYDGDTIFAMATAEVEADVSLVGTMAAEAVEMSIINAVKFAETAGNVKACKDLI